MPLPYSALIYCHCYLLVLVRVIVIKQHDQKQLGENDLVYACPSLLIIEEVRIGTQIGRNLEVGADCLGHRRAAYWLASHGLYCLHCCRTPGHQPSGDPTQNGLDPSPSIINKISYRLVCNSILMGAFS